MSAGLAYLNPGEDISLDALIDCADQVMYAAKQQGRNCLVAWSESECGMTLEWLPTMNTRSPARLIHRTDLESVGS